ncbi:hypothetical protein HLRTI_000662 [Halorhabdus tiamatea SARL4B]|uniref:Conserved hypothetical membrane protein n=1 Tax=Halorhabdus tiamatea SARL4B TaxID=1033806 RepID=F7PFX6_9EURY|nr:hypothetical protein [Halorhabdus tiamatea]ERJ07304.1 hypothetical protein HLRTI_000662 [Halorhabdus tiamatea SARL4B]CCQ34214.1 conserved hypothetical membrane protein [Halorhabdus tiamatea SARL4B]
MTFRQLCLLEARNVNYRSLLLSVVVLGFLFAGTPLLELLTQSTLPLAVRRFYLFFLGFEVTYLFVLTLGLTATIREKHADVFDRVFTMPGATWQILGAKVTAIAGISFLLGYGTIAALGVHAGFAPWLVLGYAPVIGILAVGLAAGAVAAVLYFETPRLVFFGGIIAFIGLNALPERLLEWGLSLETAVAGTMALAVLLALLGLLALRRVPPERVVLA